SVVQHTWALILGLTQHIREYGRMVSERAWTEREVDTVLSHPIHELDGRVFGVVGWGQLGRAAPRVAQAFAVRVVAAPWGRTLSPGPAAAGPAEPDRLELDLLLSVADILSLHCPLNDATRLMIGARELALLKPGALLINTARAGLVDGAALRDA